MKHADEKWVVGVSGGPDSVYLLHRLLGFTDRLVLGHLNHGARGRASDEDMEFVERMGKGLGIEVKTGQATALHGAGATGAPGFEGRARNARKAFLLQARQESGASRVLIAHTADDQVETVLMRIFEGAGISGLKGIPRRGAGGVERPLLDTWREDILRYLRRHRIPYRTDESNFDTRFERNWVRRVLIPLLEKRYGKALKKRIFTLGERFREIDEFLEATVRRWVKRKVAPLPGDAPTFRLPRSAYAKLPPVVRKRALQLLCHEGMGVAPNERLLEAMDAIILSGKASARLNIGRGASLSCRYGEAFLGSAPAAKASDKGRAALKELVVRELVGRATPARLRRLADGERKAVIDADAICWPLCVRALRAGDRIRPFGAAGEKKVKEMLIDRKVPRDERWGRPVVCDGGGEIVWIPGVVRSSIAPVTRDTRRAVVLGLRPPAAASKSAT